MAAGLFLVPSEVSREVGSTLQAENRNYWAPETQLITLKQYLEIIFVVIALTILILLVCDEQYF